MFAHEVTITSEVLSNAYSNLNYHLLQIKDYFLPSLVFIAVYSHSCQIHSVIIKD